MKKFAHILSILICFASAAVAQEPAAKVIHQTQNGTALIGGHFALKDHTGKLRRDQEFRGKYMLIYFGYSFCPDICPQALVSMTEALNQLGSKGDQVIPIFITVDPDRDTPEQLDLYRQNFHPKMITLTGNQAEIKQAMQKYRVYAAKAKPDGTTADYLVDHSSIIYLMDPQGQFVTHFNHATPPEKIAATLKTLL